MTWFMGISLEPPRGSENNVKKMAIIATITSRYIKLLRIQREFIGPP